MNKTITAIAAGLFTMALLAGCSKTIKYADTVVYGTIFTAEKNGNEVAEAFAVKNGKYISVGTREDVAPFIKKGFTTIIDQTGKGLIIPGCTEGHAHYFGGTGLNSQLPGSGKNYDEVLDILDEQVKSGNLKQFVSFGCDSYELLEKRSIKHNFAEQIESIAPGIPVVLINDSGHGAVCNTTALNKAGITKDHPEVRGGEVDIDNAGNLSGYVADQAVYYVIDKAIGKSLTDEQYDSACKYAMNCLLKLGYTNALEAFANMYNPTSLYASIKRLDDAGELKINVAGCYNIKSYDSEFYKDKVDEVSQIVKNYSAPHFNPGYIKLFADGVVEAATGWISGEYKNVEDSEKHGNIIWNQNELNSIVRYANEKNIIVHTHSYGDAACKSTLDAYIHSNETNGKKFRNCLAHVRNIQADDISRAAENGIPVAENLIWHTDYDESDQIQSQTKELILNHVPEELYNSGYPMKSLLKKGVVMSSSTDAPAAEYVEGSIMNVLEVATTGITPGENSQAFAEDELITVREGLKALTINGAWQLGLENERGSIKVGKFADFVILDKNILDYEGEQLRTIGDTKILCTYFEGEEVYSAQ